MNNTNTIKLTVMFTLTTLVGFITDSSVYAAIAPKAELNETTRVSHAKELLGKGYRGSFAQRAEDIEDLRVTILESVNKNLPKKYKASAPALAETIIREAQARDFDPVFVMAVIKTESSFNPKARGQFGEIGLMQLKPDTAEWMAKLEGISWKGPKATLENPIENVKLGVAYLAKLRDKFDGYANKYLSAYNMGARAVARMYKKDTRPKEYSLRVMKNYKDIYTKLVTTNKKATLVAEAN